MSERFSVTDLYNERSVLWVGDQTLAAVLDVPDEHIGVVHGRVAELGACGEYWVTKVGAQWGNDTGQGACWARTTGDPR